MDENPAAHTLEIEALEKKLRKYQELDLIKRQLLRQDDLGKLLDMLAESAARLISAETVAIPMLSTDSRQVRYNHAWGRHKDTFMGISLPIGLGAGIYMAEYAGQGRGLRFLRLCIETLAATPSIVLALFGMIVFVQMMGWSFSIRSGAVTLALLNIPVITRVTEVSLRSVPRELMEASYGLGATKLQTILKVALPYAATGILTGLVLTAGRAFGESAILVFTAGTNTSQVFPDFRLTVPGETLSVHLWYVTSDGTLPDAREVAAGTAAVMILVLLVLNLLVRFLDRAIRRRTR